VTTNASPTSVRLPEPLLARVDEVAGAEGIKRTELLTELVEQGLNARGLDRLMLSTSQIASLDQTAARWGLSRVEAMQRILSERILREFTEERQRQLNEHVKRNGRQRV
jgi:predicted DNA-binding protein